MFKTKQFNKWEQKQTFAPLIIETALEEVIDGVFEANLGGHLYKKRVAFAGKGKSGSGRLIICFKIGDRAIIMEVFEK